MGDASFFDELKFRLDKLQENFVKAIHRGVMHQLT
jgi:hypothetical protein